MSPLTAVAAAVVLAAALVAVTAARVRLVLLAALITLVAAPLVADPVPGIPALATRVTASVLAVVIVWVAARDARVEPAPSALGLAALAALAGTAAIGAAVAGASFRGGVSMMAFRIDAIGPGLPIGAAAGLLVVGGLPALHAQDALRLVVGLLTLIAGAGIAARFLDPAMPDAVEVGLALASASVAGVGASAIGRAIALGGFDIRAAQRNPPVVEPRRARSQAR